MPDRETIISELTTLGRGKLENFNMADPERLAHASALPVEGYSPDTGYCHGVCLDWIRRVLQNGRPCFGANPQRNAEEGYDYYTRMQEQAKRQGYAWASFNAISDRNLEANNALIDRNQADYDQAYDKYLRAKRFLQEVNSQLVDDYNRNLQLGEAHVVGIDYGDKLKRIFPQLQNTPTELSVRQIGGLYPKVEDKYRSLQAPVRATAPRRQDIDQNSFALFTGHMDAKFPKKRTFGGIALLQSSPKTQYASLSAAIDAVTAPAPTDFSSGRAMIVGFGMRKARDNSGHAAAIHWHPRDVFVVLEPNYGMFVYERLAGNKSVSSALDYLFGTVYPAEPGTEVTNGVEYEIYEKRVD
ncbi:hypothetical protein G3N58_24525 [Paraburkholderia sp. Ac-20342]|uniref:hypothetical protein n=1 Tax=Paraburkholderia sp. Ac-20342 TaxID=2703889 RepID=UPI00197E862B|nr:hypothetical protein [Paraburkholderia sp. Ac-20342]MBN3849963.1 hypothetical protein [Paraburkholderia sp. Ac-20342]